MKLTTFSDRDTKERALNDVYNLLAFSYRSVAGGFLYKPLDLLSKENTTWHTCLQNGKLKSVMIHKETHVGKKVILCGCDGTREGKQEKGIMIGEGGSIIDLNGEKVKEVWNCNSAFDEGAFVIRTKK